MRDPFRNGEDDFVARLARRFPPRPGARAGSGIGDDAALLPGRPVRVVTTDLLVEGVHFEHRLLSPAELAARAVEANLSDIAAMGARPEALLLGLAWPLDRAGRARAGRFLDGLESACRSRGVPLVGGDTTAAAEGHAVIAITAIGRPCRGGPVLRSGGRPGDALVVTGPLGGAAAGLALLRGELDAGAGSARAAEERAVAAFRTPRARLDLASALARHATALIDLSDGLGLDLPRLARASGCGFEVVAESVPVHDGALLAGPEGGLSLALAGGEDYELLAAIPPGRLAAARRAAARAGGALTEIGRLVEPGAVDVLIEGRGSRPWPRCGWDPIARPPRLDAGGPRAVGEGERQEPARE